MEPSIPGPTPAEDFVKYDVIYSDQSATGLSRINSHSTGIGLTSLNVLYENGKSYY